MRLLVVCLLVLTGCTTFEERVQTACARLGMGPESPHYPQCVQQMIQADTANRAMWLGVMTTGAAISTQQNPVYVAPTPTVTNCWRAGYYVQCQ